MTPDEIMAKYEEALFTPLARFVATLMEDLELSAAFNQQFIRVAPFEQFDAAAFGSWPQVPPSPTPPPAPPQQGGSYEPMDTDEATQVLLDTAQGKYHRESFHDRVLALEKDGIFLCRKK